MSKSTLGPRPDLGVTNSDESEFPEHAHLHDESEGGEFLDNDLRMVEQPFRGKEHEEA